MRLLLILGQKIKDLAQENQEIILYAIWIEDDNYKYRNQVLGLHQGCVKFGTFYLAKGGSIGIMLIPIGTTKGAVMILYENDEVLMKQKLHDLNDI